MTVDKFSRIYARQEYLTPGEPETLAFVEEAIRVHGSRWVLEVAAGKGEAACVLAAATGCQVVAVEPHVPFLRVAAGKLVERGLRDRVQLLRARGERLPVAGGAFDAGYCIGAPSIVGLEACLRELRRAVRPGGAVVVSDLVWRRKPEAPLGPEWKWLAQVSEQPSAEEYRDLMEVCGLRVERIHVHDRGAWDVYHQGMLAAAADERARGEAAWAEQVEADVELERRGLELFYEYATFVAHSTADM